MNGWRLDAHRTHYRRAWSPAGVTIAQVGALALPAAAAIYDRGLAQVAILVVALIVSLGWETGFAVARRRPASWHGVTTAIVFTVMVSPEVALWQTALAVSFGAVFGELVFGGRGYGFLSAAAAALGFLVFSFSDAGLASTGPTLALATLPGAVLLLGAGLVSWRVVLTAGAVIALAGLAGDGWSGAWFSIAAVLFGLVFMIGDPFCAATTNPGRYVYGLLASGLIILFDTIPGPDTAPLAMVFAALLASLFAPAIDHFAVAALLRYRRVGNG